MIKKVFTIKKARIFANIIILMIISFSIFFVFNGNSSYAFSYNNNEVIYYGNKESNKVSLMINVYWGTEYIHDMLEVLDDYNVKCTFFVGGSWAEKNENTLKLIFNMGHEIGNHGYFHLDQNKLNYSQNLEEIKATHSIVKNILGIEMNLFAPPSGAFNTDTLKAVSDQKYTCIMWSKDTIDWRDKNETLVFNRATDIKGGYLVLAHPTSHTLSALPKILDYYKNNNLKACTVSENLL